MSRRPALADEIAELVVKKMIARGIAVPGISRHERGDEACRDREERASGTAAPGFMEVDGEFFDEATLRTKLMAGGSTSIPRQRRPQPSDSTIATKRRRSVSSEK